MTTATRQKRKGVPAKAFTKAYTEAYQAGKTAQELATELGMDIKSFGVRVSQLRREFRERFNKALPSLKGSGSVNARKTDYDELLGIAGSILTQLDETDEAATEASGDVEVSDDSEDSDE